jgi:crotonobetaine/carnitine-CoA ligase
MLERAASRHGERPLLEIAGGTWRYCDAPQAVARRAGALRAAGVARGDRVALMCGNRIEQLEIFLACGWIGAVAVPINTAAMGPQIDYYVKNSGARLLVLEREFVSRLHTGVRTWVVDDGLPQADAVDADQVAPGDTLAILYTSGTTGPAKGVVCPHAQYYWWGLNTADILGVREDDVLCTTLPLFHINALNTFAQALLTGSRVAFEAKFSVSGFWDTMHARRATVTYLLGAMVPMLLSRKSPAEKTHRVRVALAPGVPEAAALEFRSRTGAATVDGYGSTETNFVLAAPADFRKGVMGRVRPGFEARVAEDGELELRADDPLCFASGYFGMPDKTAEAWCDGWFRTGDRVARDADGTFRFVDRIKDAIRRRGENVSSWEVEQVLLSHPAVAQAAVYPVRSELAEDEVMAALVLKEKVGAAEICAWCETRLPKFAIPRYIDIAEDLPRTENGKVQKFRLRERGVTPATWDRESGTPPAPSRR